MIPLPHVHTLGDYRNAIEAHAEYPGAGTGTDTARIQVTLGLFNCMVGDISEHYAAAAAAGGTFTPELLDALQDEMGTALFHITRSVVEFGTASAGLLWGQDLSEMHKPVHIDSPAHAWMSVPRAVVQTDFGKLHDAQLLLRALAYAAARHGWTLQDLAWTNLRRLIARQGVLAGAAL